MIRRELRLHAREIVAEVRALDTAFLLWLVVALIGMLVLPWWSGVVLALLAVVLVASQVHLASLQGEIRGLEANKRPEVERHLRLLNGSDEDE